MDHFTSVRIEAGDRMAASRSQASCAQAAVKSVAASLAIGIALLGGLLSNASAETLKIGVIAPLTGPAAAWGQATAGGPKILASEINAKGGLEVGGKKYQVEVVAYDDQYKAADAVAAYNRLVKQDGAKYVIVMTSASTLAIKQNAEDDKVIALTSSLTPKAFDDKTKYMFRLYSPPTHFLSPLIGWMRANLKDKRIVIINPNDETGWAQTENSQKVYKTQGFEVVGSELYERTTKDFQPLLTKLIGMKPEIIDVSTSSPATAGLIIRQARELGFKGVFVQTGAGGVADILAGAGKEAAEGTVNVIYADPANPGYQRLAAEYKKANGQEPNNIIVAFYDAANILLRAVQKAGSVDDTAKVAASFAQVLPAKSVQGDELSLGGKAEIGVDNQIMTVNYVGVIRNGAAVIVGKIR
jgi:branched-chain amino acid transport system substrate-binding protein